MAVCMLAYGFGPHAKIDHSIKKESHLGRVFSCLDSIRKNTEATAKVIRLAGYIADFAGKVFGIQSFFVNFMSSNFVENADIIDSVHIIRDIKYWIKGEFKKDSYIMRFTNLVFTGVSSSCITVLLDDLGFINLGKIAQTIGDKISFLKPICQMSRNTLIRGQLTLGFLLLLIDTTRSKSGNEAKQRQTRIDKFQFITQVGLNALYTFGMGSNVYMSGLGILAYGLGVESYVHRYLFKSQVEKKEETKPLNEVIVL